jgi:hypothetical protein
MPNGGVQARSEAQGSNLACDAVLRGGWADGSLAVIPLSPEGVKKLVGEAHGSIEYGS